MRIIQGFGVLFAVASCSSSLQTQSTAPANAASSRPTISTSFGNDIPLPVGSGGSGGTGPTGAPDPTVTDGDKYHVILENSRVRVLRYQDKPGDKTKPHHHDEFVLYALSGFRRRLTFPDGSVRERDFKPGDVIWMPEQVHTGENVGATDTDVIIVENKLAAGIPVPVSSPAK